MVNLKERKIALSVAIKSYCEFLLKRRIQQRSEANNP